MATIKVQAFTIGHAAIYTHPGTLELAKIEGRLDHEYDYRLSDMPGHTFMVSPNGEVLWPFGAPAGGGTVMDLLRPVLDVVPGAQLLDYLAQRFIPDSFTAAQRAEEEK